MRIACWLLVFGWLVGSGLASEPGLTAVVARGVAERQAPFLPATAFLPDTARIFLIVASEREGWTEAVAQWRGPGGQMLGTDGIFLARGERKALFLDAPPGGFQPGGYGVRLLADGVEAAALEFRILDAPETRAEEELEPNDTAERASPIGGTLRVRGQIAEAEQDFFVFELKGRPQLWRIEAEGRSVGRLAYQDISEGGGVYRTLAAAGRMAFSGLYLLPGKHWISVSGAGRPAVYELRLTGLGPPDLHSEREPNNDSTRAESLLEGSFRQGTLGEAEDVDLYRFSTAAREPVSFRMSLPEGLAPSLSVLDESNAELARWQADGSSRELRGTLLAPPGDYTVVVNPRGSPTPGFYRLHFERQNLFLDPGTPAPELPGIHLAPAQAPAEFAAYWNEGQSQRLGIRVRNEGSEAVALQLEARANQPRVLASLQPSSLVVEAGGEALATLALDVPPDLASSDRLQVSLRASRADGARALGTFAAPCACAALPLNPKPAPALPEKLLGLLDVAWTSLGASVVVDGFPEADRAAALDRLGELFDGLTPKEAGLVLKEWDRLLYGSPFAATVRLAGEREPLVEGILLHPQASAPPSELLKEFTLLLSRDGMAFEEALSGSLSGLREEQSFPLPQPTAARYARLLLRSNQAGQAAPIGLGEWKVLASAAPGVLGSAPLNLAEPDKGGYVVFSDPLLPVDPYSPLTEKADGFGIPLGKGTRMSWTVGFLHDRAALLAGFEWVSADVPSWKPASRVSLETALESPLGPWQPIGEWPLEPGPGQATRILFAEPRQARYVRFTASLEAYTELVSFLKVLRIFEQPSGAEYPSILGEWGHGSREAGLEWRSPAPPLPPVQELSNTSREQAFALESGLALGQELALAPAAPPGGPPAAGGWFRPPPPAPSERWYRVAVPDGHNTLEIELEARPQLPLDWEAWDGRGNALPLEVVERTGTRALLRAAVRPGAELLLRVWRPPHSVVLAWDNSMSVARFLPNIYRAVDRFASTVEAGQEFVNLLPFSLQGSRFLLPDWSDDPFALYAALGNYARSDTSSNAEAALLDATIALGKRKGARAIVVVTDADTASYDKTLQLWTAFAACAPRIFAIDMHLARAARPFQHLMQSWASVAAGRYDAFRTQRELDLGFERAACLLRRPTRYAIRAATRFEAPKQPGSLAVLADPAAPVSRGSESAPKVELILDASGSMNRKLGGRTMMEAAKRTLLKVIGTLPPESQVALRVYGRRIREGQPGDCQDTELLRPLGRLAPQELASSIQGVQALGTTLIDHSLRQVAGDLAGASGESVVVLVTDGEEECGGDPEAAVLSLQEQGIPVRVNIVGFHLGDNPAKSTLERAANASRGAYFDASDEQGLEQALRQAFAPPFSVFDRAGVPVADGIVGGRPVELAPGRYELRIEGMAVGAAFEIREGRRTSLRISKSIDGTLQSREELP